MMGKMLLVLLSFVMLTGCGVQDHILEDVLLAEVVGYDTAEADKIKGSTVVSVSQSGEKSSMGKEVYTAVTHTDKNVRQQIESEAPRSLVGGRLSAILYGEKLARKGIYDYVDTYRRDPAVGRDLYLAVVSGKAEDIINVESKMLKTPGVKTEEIIDHNSKTHLPETSLHSFLYYYSGKNMDPVLPLLEVEQNHIKIKGIALFKDDTYIGKYIKYEDGFLFKVLLENFKKGVYEARIKEHSYIAIDNISSRVKYEIKDGNGSPEISIKAKIKGGVLEARNIELKSQSAVTAIEKKSEKTLEKKLDRMVKMFQDNNIDPLALGDRVRSQTRNFDSKHWEDVYRTVPIKVDVDVELVQQGITD
ncbi:Ger(x)C family spore germination protein [Peribacillus cavernae]|uniref:Ger(X)C family spore germination protein n=1 Tax=Peribacillus cavernae TaxID=1674310 RepID=A0A3S0TRR9_9BACI|nr:Ger(x)C family spore germination protein [Peribacillus cavernae]MDQ0219696.1 spore germination protein [Peribacillus cavernae]RUQ25974.1 Ger(x)C family spore germination protein [Peribacillus cavernae]